MKLSIDANPTPERDKQNTSTPSLQPQSTNIRAPDNEVLTGTNFNSNQAASQLSGFPLIDESSGWEDEDFLQLLWGHYHVLLGKLLQEVHSSEYRIPFESRFRIGNTIVSTHEREIRDSSTSLGNGQMNRLSLPKPFLPAAGNSYAKSIPIQSAEMDLESMHSVTECKVGPEHGLGMDNLLWASLPRPEQPLHGPPSLQLVRTPIGGEQQQAQPRMQQKVSITEQEVLSNTQSKPLIQSHGGSMKEDGGGLRDEPDTMANLLAQAAQAALLQPQLAQSPSPPCAEEIDFLRAYMKKLQSGTFATEPFQGAGADISRSIPPSTQYRSQIPPEFGQISNGSYKEIGSCRSVVDELLELWTISA